MFAQISMNNMVHIFGDTYIPDSWIKDMKERSKRDGTITQEKAIIILKELKFEWCENSKEYLFDNDSMNWPSVMSNFREDTYDSLICGADMTGSPGHNEIFILNLLAIAYPIIPFNIIKQITHEPLRPPIMSRKHGVLLKKEGINIKSVEMYNV